MSPGSLESGARKLASSMQPWLRATTFALVVALTTPAWGEEIVAVLERSQLVRLASLPSAAAHSERAIVVHRSFDELVQRLEARNRVELRIVTGPVIAESLLGHVVVANEALADLDEPARRFVLAHELGHVMLGHWQQMTQVYSKHMPGEFQQASMQDQSASDALLIEMSRLSQAHELEADAFAYAMLRPLGYGFSDLVGGLTAFGMQRDTATHPGTGKRIAHLRSLG